MYLIFYLVANNCFDKYFNYLTEAIALITIKAAFNGESTMEGFGAIPIFVAVREQGGFSAAARSLGITKSAVSKRVTLLEDHLGVKLLHSSTITS